MPIKHNKKLIPIARMLRRNMTEEEKQLWYAYLRTYPVRFYRQKVLGCYIVDFYCAKAKLVVEVDGAGHYSEKGQRNDEKRTEFLKQYGLTVIRIPNNEIRDNLRGVCDYIDEIVKCALT